MLSFNAMQKFILKTFYLILGTGLIFNLSGLLADRVAPLEDWRFDHQQKLINLRERNYRIEAITLGNSHSDSIDYSILGYEGQSLAFAAADLFEIEKYILFLDNKLPNLKTVFITISYYSFSRDNAAFESLRSRRIGFYSLVPVWSPIQGDQINFLLGRLDSYTHVQSVIRSDSWQGVWLGLLTLDSQTDPFLYDGVHTTSAWGECFHYTREQLATHAREIVGRNVSSSVHMASVHLGLEQDAFDALVRSIERLQSRGVQVILFTPPYHESYNANFIKRGPQIISNMRLAVSNLQQTHWVEYYDFSQDSELTIHPELFYNSDHLSECGHKVFSAKLLEAMTENIITDK